jgi:membrane fusion protein (multidrug efflux system)
VRQEGNVARLYAVVQGRVHERIVQTGEREGNRVAVLRGVEAGELVIAAPGAGVRDGARVE